MRDPRNRFRVGRLFVLGAGASFSASSSRRNTSRPPTPLDRDFTKRIKDLDYERPAWVKTARERILKAWADHTPFEEMNLEAAIIRQLSHMEFFHCINRRRRSHIEPAEYVDDIAHLITFALGKSKEAESEVYRHFAGKVFPPSSRAESPGAARIITFNYDTLLDNHLNARFSPERVYFDRIKRKREDGDRRKAYHREPLIVKLHGSVNWRCTTAEFKKVVAGAGEPDHPYWIPSVWIEDKRLPSIDDDESPLIMPPIPNKPLTKIQLFQFLWSRACEYLHEAEEIVICGYSLPDADALAMSLFGNLTNDRLKRVTVVDPDPSMLAKWRSLLIRPRVRRAEWSYHADFSEYVQVMT